MQLEGLYLLCSASLELPPNQCRCRQARFESTDIECDLSAVPRVTRHLYSATSREVMRGSSSGCHIVDASSRRMLLTVRCLRRTIIRKDQQTLSLRDEDETVPFLPTPGERHAYIYDSRICTRTSRRTGYCKRWISCWHGKNCAWSLS